MPRTLPAALTTAMDSGVFKAYLAIGKRNYTAGVVSSYTTLITNILYYKYDGLELTVKWASPNLPETDGLTLGNKYYIERGVTISGVNYTIKSASLRFDDYTYQRQIITATFSLFSADEKPTAVAGDDTYTNVLTALNPNTAINGTVDFKTTPENPNHWSYNFYAAGKQVILKSYASFLPILQQKYLLQVTDNSDDTNEDEIQYFHLRSPIAQSYWSAVLTSTIKLYGMAYSPEQSLYIAIGLDSGNARYKFTSSDGLAWTGPTAVALTFLPQFIIWSSALSLWVTVGLNGATKNIATSPDGITWTEIVSSSGYYAVASADSISTIVAVGTANKIATSTNGTTWTERTSPNTRQFHSVCWSSELSLFVAVSWGGGSGTYAITSPDGITWTERTMPGTEYESVCWSPELTLFVAVGTAGVATSPDGITWTARTPAAANQWYGIAWSAHNGYFMAVSQTGTGNRVMTSPDGITWTSTTTGEDKTWQFVMWSNGTNQFYITAVTDFLSTTKIATVIDAMSPDYTIQQGDIKLKTDNLSRKFTWRDEAGTISTSGSATDIVHNLGYLESTDNPPSSFDNSDRASVTVGVHLKYKTGDIYRLKINDTQTATYLGRVTEILDPNAEIGWRCEIELMERFGNTDGGPLPSTIERVAAYTPLVTTNFNNNLDSTVNNLQALADKIDDLVLSSGDMAKATYDTDNDGVVDNSELLQGNTASAFAIASKGVTNGDSHNHNNGDGGTIAYTSLSGRPLAETNANAIFSCSSPGGTSAWTGTINGAPSGASVTLTTSTGTKGSLKPTATTHLAKMRLYNLTRGNHALISDFNTTTNVCTLTANAPAGWTSGDSMTIASQTVTGAPISYADLEITSGPTSKTYLILSMICISATAGDNSRMHPLETYGSSKQKTAQCPAANMNGLCSGEWLKITSNVFSVGWTGTPTTIQIVESGVLE